MDVAAFVVAVLALAVSGASVVYVRQAAHAAKSEAASAAAAERRANEPRLVVQVEQPVEETATSAIYTVRNDGPIDLDRVAVHRPKTADGIRYAVAPVGEDWRDDEAELGPLSMGQTARFVLSIGSARRPPEFRVRVVSARGGDAWEQAILLGHPRRPRVIIG